jgi:hypothetical protein
MTYQTVLASLPAIGGIMVGVIAVLRGFGLKEAAPMSLELFTAAGLLKLSQDSSWRAIACAGAIIAVRKMVTTSLSFYK